MKLTNIKVFSFIHTFFMHGPVLVGGRAYAGIRREWKIEEKSYVYRAASGDGTWPFTFSQYLNIPPVPCSARIGVLVAR